MAAKDICAYFGGKICLQVLYGGRGKGKEWNKKAVFLTRVVGDNISLRGKGKRGLIFFERPDFQFACSSCGRTLFFFAPLTYLSELRIELKKFN